MEKNTTIVPTFNVMVGYDAIIRTEIDAKIKETGIKPNIITDVYFYIESATAEDIQKIKDEFSGIKFTFKNNKGHELTYKVLYISSFKHGYVTRSVAKNNKKTKTAKKSASKIEFKYAKKRMKKGSHSSGSNRTNFEKKTLAEVKKAIKFIEKKKNDKNKIIPTKNKITKPTQGKLKFAA